MSYHGSAANDKDLRGLERLDLGQAQAVAALLNTEGARLILRDALLVAYRRLLPPGRSATFHASILSDELRSGDPTHPHAAFLDLIIGLCRGQAAPGTKTVERVLLRAERHLPNG